VKVPFSVIRFLLEATFIVLIAAATAVAHLGVVWIALSVGGAWILVTVVERSAFQGGSVLQTGCLAFLFAEGRPQAVPEDSVQEIPPQDFSFETAAAEHPPTPDPEPEPPPPEPAPPAPEPVPPTPEPGAPPPQLRSVPPPQPESEAPPEEVPEPVVRLPLDAGEPREWNVWELERLARGAGSHSSHEEELAFLLLELRQFANADGQLPVGFDPIVRESFGELLYAAV
jgi:hypothetical protein